MLELITLPQYKAQLCWCAEKLNIGHFLVNYCKHKYPDKPEYMERYTTFINEWKTEKDKIIQRIKEDMHLPSQCMVEFDTYSDRLFVYGCSPREEEISLSIYDELVKELSEPLIGSEFSSQNLADMLYPVPHGEVDKKSRDNIRMREITFQVTERCNLKCKYCYQINKAPNDMTFETAKKLVDIITGKKYRERYSNTIGFVLDFIGGEPFLKVELMDQIIDYYYDTCIKNNLVYAYNTRISTCTNGTLYNKPEVRNFLKKYGGLIAFSVSVDGNKELHDSCRIFPDGSGSYDYAIAACKEFAIINGRMPGSKMTISHENIPYICDAVISMIDNDYIKINLNCVYENVWKPGDATMLYEQLKKLADYLVDNNLCQDIYVSIFNYNGFKPVNTNEMGNYCGGNGAMLSMDYKGDLFPCIRFMKSSLGDSVEPLCIGDTKGGLLYTEKQKMMFNELSTITRVSQSEDKCLHCPIESGCGWCTGLNYQLFGTPNKRATFICEMHQARALASAYMWNKWFYKHNLPFVMHNYIPREWATKIVSESEFDMILDQERNILLSEDGARIAMTNFGSFNEGDTFIPWGDVLNKPGDNEKIEVVYDE